jgi:hypothetical protein
MSQSMAKWTDLAMAGIGALMTGLTSLFRDTSATVESLGDTARSQIESTEHTRGLVAGDQTMAISEISGELSKAMRATNTLIAEGNRILAQIATALGQPTQANNAAGAGGYSISVETLGGARV